MPKERGSSAIQVTAVFLIFALAVLVGMTSLTQPDVVRSDAPSDFFSAERAMKHLRIIS